MALNLIRKRISTISHGYYFASILKQLSKTNAYKLYCILCYFVSILSPGGCYERTSERACYSMASFISLVSIRAFLYSCHNTVLENR